MKNLNVIIQVTCYAVFAQKQVVFLKTKKVYLELC